MDDWPRLLGDDTEVPCADGRVRRYVNLDNAASTPALAEVWDAVEAFMPWYSSVHRGTGAKSQVATAAYEDARASVAAFVGARPGDGVALVRNTTEAINVLAAALPEGTRVVSTPVEHHANMLPWRRHDLRLIPFPRSAADLLDAVEKALPADVVAVTGASNVTGEVWPLRELAALAHAHGARLFVDAAQLAPHRPLDMAADGIDLVALSGHKLYAPFGAGALVGRLPAGEPLLRGGGAVDLVTLDGVDWLGGPERYEAGSPNVVGAVALGAACRRLSALGMDRVAARERRLAAKLEAALEHVPGLRRLRLWAGGDRVGVATFELGGYRHPLLASILSAEHGIGVRHGCFCAHPLMAHLLGEPLDHTWPRPGAVRASLGLGTTQADLDRLVGALRELAHDGPRATYAYDEARDEYRYSDWRTTGRFAAPASSSRRTGVV